MRNIFINRNVVEGPWGGGNQFVRAFFEKANRRNYNIVTGIQPKLDVIMMVDPRWDDQTKFSYKEARKYKLMFPKTKLVFRVNECDKRKGEVNVIDPFIRELSEISDLTIFVSSWVRDLHVQNGIKFNKSTFIHNGVDNEVFKPSHKLSDIDGKIHIVTHHWSNNPFKGHDIYKKIDAYVADVPNVTFTYIGRSHDILPNSRIVKPLYGHELGKELGRYDVYISGSRWDPGPNHVLESLSCGLPTYVHVDGGGSVELAGADHAYDEVESLLDMISQKSYSMNTCSIMSWDQCIDRYFDEIDKLFEG